jgi:ketosteroid isomerase-like protein
LTHALTIVRCENELRQAMLSADVGALDRLIADDIAYVDPAGRVLSKEMDLEMHRSGRLRIQTIETSETEMRIADPIAVVITRAAIAGLFEGQPFAGDFRFTRVWREIGGNWRIVAGHCCAIAPEPAPA